MIGAPRTERALVSRNPAPVHCALLKLGTRLTMAVQNVSALGAAIVTAGAGLTEVVELARLVVAAAKHVALARPSTRVVAAARQSIRSARQGIGGLAGEESARFMVRGSTEAKGACAPTIPHNGGMQADLNKSAAGANEVSRFSAQEFRTALGLFATGVTIVTALSADGTPVGLTVNSFNSVSLAPPLVLWSLGLRAGTLPVFTAAEHYAIHVLKADQRALAERFAARDIDRFSDVAWHPGLGGVPVLEGCAAVFQCANHQQHDAGDHRVFIGDVRACESAAGGAAPLIFHGGRFYTELPL